MRALRFLLAVVLCAVPMAPAAPVSAARPGTNLTDVRQHVTGLALVYVLGKDKAVYRVTTTFSIVHGQATKPYSYAIVSVSKCKNGSCPQPAPVSFLVPLTTSQYNANDLKKVSLSFAGLGKPIGLTLTGTGPGDVDTNPSVQGTALDTTTSWSVVAKVTFQGITCTDKAAIAARHTTVYPTGYDAPTGFTAMPAKPVAGTPAGLRSCRPGPK